MLKISENSRILVSDDKLCLYEGDTLVQRTGSIEPVRLFLRKCSSPSKLYAHVPYSLLVSYLLELQGRNLRFSPFSAETADFVQDLCPDVRTYMVAGKAAVKPGDKWPATTIGPNVRERCLLMAHGYAVGALQFGTRAVLASCSDTKGERHVFIRYPSSAVNIQYYDWLYTMWSRLWYNVIYNLGIFTSPDGFIANPDKRWIHTFQGEPYTSCYKPEDVVRVIENNLSLYKQESEFYND